MLTRLARLVTAPILQQLDGAIHRVTTAQRQQVENLMVLHGTALAAANAERAPFATLKEAEFKVFSQFGEDGIIQYLIREVAITQAETSFIEFGVQDYSESSTRFLLMKDNWRGLIIDGSKSYMDTVRGQDLHWRHDLTVMDAWIDRDNINDLIRNAGFEGRIGILSIDIDGNDYWVWERIDAVDPVIVIVEWNSVFGPDHAISAPYDAAFQRERAHYSNLYWGASISAFAHLAERKGYALLGSNSAGNNIFFVRKDRLGRLTTFSPQEAFVESRFRDSRDTQGRLSFLGGARRQREILDLPVIEVKRGETTTLGKLRAVHGTKG